MKSNKIITLFVSITCFTLLPFNLILANSVYTCKDSNGNTVFTDLTDKNNDCVTEPTSKTIKPLPSPQFKKLSPNNNSVSNTINTTNNNDNDANNNEPGYNSVTITIPQNNESINRCGGTLDLSFNTDPGLYDSDIAHLYVDGSPWATSSGSTFVVTDLVRGEHNVAVKIMREGKIVASSDITYFNFLRNCAN